jgi:predicted nucleic-acid-binding Zn-ribbon protein
MGKEEKVYAIPGHMAPTGTEQTDDMETAKRGIAINLYRCSQCNYLELYDAHI